MVLGAGGEGGVAVGGDRGQKGGGEADTGTEGGRVGGGRGGGMADGRRQRQQQHDCRCRLHDCGGLAEGRELLLWFVVGWGVGGRGSE